MSKMLPGEVNDAVNLASYDVGGVRQLTYGEYRRVARALVQVKAELDKIKREQCSAQSRPHVTRGDDPQCVMCLAYLPRR